MKERLDVMLVKQGLAPSREKAKAIIMSGNVYVDNQKEDKAGSMFADIVKIEVRGSTLKYVSRIAGTRGICGGRRLRAAYAAVYPDCWTDLSGRGPVRDDSGDVF